MVQAEERAGRWTSPSGAAVQPAVTRDESVRFLQGAFGQTMQTVSRWCCCFAVRPPPRLPSRCACLRQRRDQDAVPWVTREHSPKPITLPPPATPAAQRLS
jgi:hypothetical protein